MPFVNDGNAVPEDFVSTDAGASNENHVEKLDVNGRHRRSMAFSQVGTMGETIAALDALYLKRSDGKFWKADADNTEDAFNALAIAYESATADQSKRIYSPGEIISGFSFGNETTSVSETQDQAQTTSTAATVEQIYSTRIARQTFTTGDSVGNLSRVDLYLTKVGGGGTGLTINIYAIDDAGAKSGASLGSKAIVTASLTSGAYNNFTFASAITLSPRTTYMIEITHTSSGGDGSNYWAVNGSSGTNYDRGGGSSDAQATADRTDKDTDLAFKTYYTLQRAYSLGDKVYLSNTAGGLSINEGTNPSVVGSIISSSSILFLPGFRRGALLGKVGFKSNQNSASALKFGIPRNCSRIVIMTKDGSTTCRGECSVFKVGKTVGYIGSGTTELTATWSGNELNIQEAQSTTARTVAIYFFDY